MVKVIVAAVAVATAGLLTASRRLAVIQVVGESMEPTFANGDRLLAWRRPRPLRIGDIVVLEAPYPLGVIPPVATAELDPAPWSMPPPSPGDLARRWFVKRVVALPADVVPPSAAGRVAAGSVVPPRHLMVVGDNSDYSYDSRQVGFVPTERVLGLVIRRLG